MEITHKIKMDLSQQSILPRIGVVQGDAFTRRLTIALFADKRPWKVPANATVIVRYRKSNGASGAYDTLPDGTSAVSVSGNCVSILVAPEVLSQTGNVSLMVTILSGTRQLSTFAVELAVQAMYASDQAPQSAAWIASFLPAPEGAAVGQYFAVEKVDEHGLVLSLKAVDAPTGSAEEIRAAVEEYLADLDFPTGSGSSIAVDSELDIHSENPVQNKVLAALFNTFQLGLTEYIIPKLLPAVSPEDNGKILQVAGGAWSAATIGQWSGGEY